MQFQIIPPEGAKHQLRNASQPKELSQGGISPSRSTSHLYQNHTKVLIRMLTHRPSWILKNRIASRTLKVKVTSLSCVRLFATPWTVGYHAILQARVLEWVAISFSRGSSRPRDRTRVCCIADRRFTVWATSSVQSLSHVQLFVTPWITACQASLSITNSRSLLNLVFIQSVILSSHLILCGPLLLLPPIPPQHHDFFPESTLCMRWPKYWSFSFNISPSSEHPGLISFRMDWADLLAVQGTLKSLLQHHSPKASILWHSAFFTVQLSHPYMTTEKTIALISRTFVGKVMSLLFNMLSRLVITFLPRSKHLLISLL